MSTRVYSCPEVTKLIIGNFGGTRLVDPSPDGIPLWNWYPAAKNVDNPRVGRPNSAVPDLIVIGFGPEEKEVEWLRLHRLGSGAIELRYSTSAPVEPAAQECIGTRTLNELGKYFVLESKCEGSNLLALYATSGANPFILIERIGPSRRYDQSLVESSRHNMAVGDADGNPVERLTGILTDGVLSATAWKYTPPAIEIMEGTEPVSQPLPPTEVTTTTADPAPPAETSTSTDPGNSETTTSIVETTSTSTAGVSNEQVAQDPQGMTEQKFHEVIAALDETCPEITGTVSPVGTIRTTDVVTVTPEFTCDTSWVPKGVTVETRVSYWNQTTGSVHGAAITTNGPLRKSMARLEAGTWTITILVNVMATVGENSIGSDLRAHSTAEIQVVRDDNFVNCDGEDLAWDGARLLSECLTSNDITPLVQTGFDYTRGVQTITRSGNGFPLVIDSAYRLITVGIPQSEGFRVKGMILCKDACLRSSFGFEGVDFSVVDGKYTARFTEDCDRSLAFVWGRKVGDRVVLFDNDDSKTTPVNYPGTDATVSGMDDNGRPIKGSVISAVPPAGRDIMIVAAHCDGATVFSLHEVKGGAASSTGSTPGHAFQDSATPGEQESVARIVTPVIEVPAASLTGQPVAISNATEFVSISGSEVMDDRYVSVKASVDGGPPQRLSVIGVTRIPVTRESKVLTVTYTRSDGTEVVVTKPIVNSQEVSSGGDTTGSISTIIVVTALVALLVALGVALSRRRTRLERV